MGLSTYRSKILDPVSILNSTTSEMLQHTSYLLISSISSFIAWSALVVASSFPRSALGRVETRRVSDRIDGV